MAYIRNCKVCGQRISMREMKDGHWVAFEVSTNIPHEHKARTYQQRQNLSHLQDVTPQSNTGKDLLFYLIVVIALPLLGSFLFGWFSK